jgi:uncharacterized protein (TIGR02217 family)
MFIEAPSFPTVLSFGASGGPVYHTDIVVCAGGEESRNQNWHEPLCRWDVGSQHRTQAEIEALLHFFHAVAQGTLHSFRFRDFTDDAFDNAIGVGDGTTTTFQLVKVYTYGARSVTRPVKKPMAGSLQVRVAGVVREDYDPDFFTGQMTLWTPPAVGEVVEASGTFEVPTRFATEVLPITRVAPAVYSLERIELVEVRLEDEP